MCRQDRWRISYSSCNGDRISVRESACADSHATSIPGSCVQAFKQFEVAGHVAYALAVVGVLIEVAELVTPASAVAELSEIAGQDVEFTDDGIMDSV